MAIDMHTSSTLKLPNGNKVSVPAGLRPLSQDSRLQAISVGKTFVVVMRERMDDDDDDDEIPYDDPREYEGFGTLTEYRSQSTIQEAIDQATRDGKLWYLVNDASEFSSYTVRDPATYALSWDVGTKRLYLYVNGDDMQQEFASRVRDIMLTKAASGAESLDIVAEARIEARAEFVGDTNNQLEEFHDWMKNQIWSIISLRFTPDGTLCYTDVLKDITFSSDADRELQGRLIHLSRLDFDGEAHVGFIACSKDDAGLFSPIVEFNATAYDKERGGVHVAIGAKHLEKTQALLAQYQDVLSATLHAYPAGGVELADPSVLDDLDDLETFENLDAVANAQLAWCDWNKVNVANSDYDKVAIRDSLAFWIDKAEAIKTNVVELTKKAAALAAAPALDQSAPALSM